MKYLHLSVWAISIAIPLLAGITNATPPVEAPITTDSAFRPALLGADCASISPYTTLRVHDAGNLHFSITNWGLFGAKGFTDRKTGLRVQGAYFPAGSSFEHINYGSIWIGGIVKSFIGDDTLVSSGGSRTGTEFLAESYSQGGDFIERSNDPASPHYDPESSSPQEFICTFTDTVTDPSYVPIDWATMRPHRPLGIKVRQISDVWPFEYSEDFGIIRYWITNISTRTIHSLYIGFAIHPSVRHDQARRRAGAENMVGFLHSARSISGFNLEDTFMTAWWTDNDGDPYRDAWNELSVLSAMGIRILGINHSTCDKSIEPLKYSFNWCGGGWGPQKFPGDKSINGGRGVPVGDKQRYRYLSNGEIDYDQHLMYDDETIGQGWMEPPEITATMDGIIINYADGHDVLLLLSVGSVDLAPGDSISIGLALAAGDFFHRNPRNGRNLSKNPRLWYKNLDFSDLIRNVQWASMIYDNPGVDTDGDGCAGEYIYINCRDTTRCNISGVCYDLEICDSVTLIGDGIPDLKGPPPPPAPQITIHNEPGTIRIRWDGREIEHIFDPFVQREDFEGYNVYCGIGDNPNNVTLMASWDLVNFDRYRFIPTARPSPWVLDGAPLTLAQIAGQHDPYVDPFEYNDKLFPYEDEDGNLFYFQPHGGNRGNEYLEGGAVTTNPVQYIRTDSLWDEDSQTWKRFGHYECTIDNLLPSQPYYFAVTAFDAGVAAGGIESLESPVQANMQLAYPAYSPDYVEENRLKVSVYPNPYRIDGRYREKGYEDPNREGFKERMRRIHFVNLPPEATIKIFSLDGDLVRQLHHPFSRFSDSPSHTAWDMITRNTQAVVSGIYLYSIESDWGTQIGKIVILK